MKIVIKKDKEGKVLAVTTTEYYEGHSEEEVAEQIKVVNKRNPKVEFVLEEVNEDIYQAVMFLLGKDKYKVTHKIEDLRGDVFDLNKELETIRYNVERICDKVECFHDKLAKLKNFDEENNVKKDS